MRFRFLSRIRKWKWKWKLSYLRPPIGHLRLAFDGPCMLRNVSLLTEWPWLTMIPEWFTSNSCSHMPILKMILHTNFDSDMRGRILTIRVQCNHSVRKYLDKRKKYLNNMFIKQNFQLNILSITKPMQLWYCIIM